MLICTSAPRLGFVLFQIVELNCAIQADVGTDIVTAWPLPALQVTAGTASIETVLGLALAEVLFVSLLGPPVVATRVITSLSAIESLRHDATTLQSVTTNSRFKITLLSHQIN